MKPLPFNDEIETRLGYRLPGFGYDIVRALMVEHAEAAVADLQVDAARYRWIRATQNTEIRNPGDWLDRPGVVETLMVCEGNRSSSSPDPDELDEFIDRAMEKQQQGTK